VQGILDDRIGILRRLDFVHFDGLAFQLFVILKEAAEHGKAMGRHLGGFAVDVEFRIFGGHADDLVVFFAAVDHGHEADRADAGDQGQGDDGFLAEDQDVKRVIVFGQGLGDEAVIGGVIYGGIEDAIEFDQSTFLVQLVFHAGAEGDFDDGGEFMRNIFAGRDIMPRVDHPSLSIAGGIGIQAANN
jgi:hypothetical protein